MRKSETRFGVRPWRVGIASAAAAAAIVAGTSVPAQAAALTVGPAQVAVAGGTVLYFSGGTALTSSLGVRFMTPTTSTCPTNYNNASVTASTTMVDGGLITAFDTATAYVTTPALPAASYKPCLYADATTGAAYASDSLAGTVASVPVATVSPDNALPTVHVNMTADTAIFTAASFGTEFSTVVCPATYATTSATVLAATTAKTSTTVLNITVPAITAGTAYYVCTYAGTTVGTSTLAARGARTFTSYSALLPTVVANPTGGSSGTATNITVTAPSAIFSGGAPATLMTRGICPLTYAAGGTGLEPYDAVTTKITTTKVAVSVPVTIIVGGMDATTSWNVCSYASTSGALLAAPSTYTVAPVLSVTAPVQFAVGSGSSATTASGPSQGGSAITVSHLTGVPTATGALLTATLGGVAITGIHVIDATSFSGVTGAHAAGAVDLAVTTAAGTKTTANQPYTYTYGITVAPNTAATAGTPVLDISGAGFSSVTTWANTTDSVATGANGYVFLTDNAWNTTVVGATPSNVNAMDNTNPPISYCNSVLAISDTELICTLNLTAMIDSSSAHTPTITTVDVPNGTYTISVVNQGNDIDANESSVVSSGSTFTVSPF